MASTMQLKFCVWCGEKRIREVTKQLDQLFNSKEPQTDKCGLCQKHLTERKTLRVTESLSQSPIKTSHAAYYERDILQQSGVTVASETDQSVIPVLLNVIKQLGRSVEQITQQRGESGDLESLVTLADVKSDDQKGERSLTTKASSSIFPSGQNVQNEDQKNIQDGLSSSKLPAPFSGSQRQNAEEIQGNLNQNVDSDDDIADPLPNAYDLPEDTIIMETMSEGSIVQEQLDMKEAQPTHISTSATEVIKDKQVGVKGLPSIPEREASSIKSECDADLKDITSLKNVLDPTFFDIIDSKSKFSSPGYILCKFCLFQCVPTGLGIRTLLNHIANQHPNKPQIEKPYRCPKCGLKGELRSRLSVHMIACGVKEKPFKCPICGNGFSGLASLGLHIKKGKHTKRPVKVAPVKKRKRGRPCKDVAKNVEEKDSNEASPRKKMKKGHKIKKKKSQVREEPDKDIARQRSCNVDGRNSDQEKKSVKNLATSLIADETEKVADDKVVSADVTENGADVTEKVTDDKVIGADVTKKVADDKVTIDGNHIKLKQTPSVVLQRLSVPPHQSMNASPSIPASVSNKSSTNRHLNTSVSKKSPTYVDDLQATIDTRILDMIHPNSDFTNVIVCQICSEPFLPHGPSFITFVHHISEHTKTTPILEPYVCRDCGLSFKGKVDLRAHFERKHRREECYECRVCGKKYALRNSYTRHLLNAHGKVKIEAEDDAISMIDIDDLSSVLDGRILDMVQPDCDFETSLVCKVCEESFRSSVIGVKHFALHIRIHQGVDVIDKPYKCPDRECNQRFSFPTDLKSHYTKAHMKKKLLLKCIQCTESFKSIEVLKKHVTLHLKSDAGACSVRTSSSTDNLTGSEANVVEVTSVDPKTASSFGRRKISDGSNPGNVSVNPGNVSVMEDADELSQSVESSDGMEAEVEHNLGDITSGRSQSCEDDSNPEQSKQATTSGGSKGSEECSNPEQSSESTTLEWSDEDKQLVFPSPESNEMDLDNPLTILHPDILNMIDKESSTTELIACRICQEKFMTFKYGVSVKRFAKHIYSHHKQPLIKQVYTCRKCDFGSPSKVSFNSHVEKSHRVDDAYSCHYCNKVFTVKNTLQRHQRQHIVTKAEPVAESKGKEGIDFANLAIILDKDLQDMLDTDYKINSSLVCKLCGVSYKPTSVGVRHFAKHVSVHKETAIIRSPYKCPECMERFAMPASVESHWKSRHKNQKVKHGAQLSQSIGYKCLQCDDLFPSGKELTDHVVNTHTDKETEICEENSPNKAEETEVSDKHGKEHTPEKVSSPDESDAADESSGEPEQVFNDDLSVVLVTNLKDMIHKDCNLENSIVCKICSASFQTSERALRQFAKHIAEHLEEPVISTMYKCSGCSEQFRSLFTLKSHWTSAHTGDEEEERFAGGESDDDEVSDGGEMFEEESEDEEDVDDEDAVEETENATPPEDDNEKLTKQAERVPPAEKDNDKLTKHAEPTNDSSNIGKEVVSGDATHVSVGELKLKNNKLASTLNPEVLEAIHADCDLKDFISCKYCQQLFKNSGHGMTYFVKHIVKHTGKPVIEKPYKCIECGEHFKRETDLYQHTIYRHGVNGNYKCQICGKSYPKRNSLYKHRKDVHNSLAKNSRIMCELCGKEVRKQCLKNHMSIHTGVYDLHCTVPGCHYKNNEERHLLQHMNHSHRSKSDLCKYCGLSFPLQGALAKHELKHVNGERIILKKYKCKDCGFSTDIINDFSLHERRHRKDYRFKCPFCEQKFLARSVCRKHIPYCKRQQGLPIVDALPVDLFVRKRRSKYENSVPVAVKKVEIEKEIPEDSIPSTCSSVTVAADGGEIEIATTILQFMQSQ